MTHRDHFALTFHLVSISYEELNHPGFLRQSSNVFYSEDVVFDSRERQMIFSIRGLYLSLCAVF